MQTLSRRGLFAAGGVGAAATVVAACGSDSKRRVEGDDAGRIADALAAELAYGESLSGGSAAGAGDVLTAAAEASRKRADELASLDVDAETQAPEDAAGEPLEASQSAIAAYRAAAGLLTDEAQRSTMAGFLAQVAAEQAAMRLLDDQDPVPFAFVTGGTEEPYEVPEADDEEDEE